MPAGELAAALQKLGAATQAAWATGVPEEALANATPYLQAFGHVVLAWLWLDVALARAARRPAPRAPSAKASWRPCATSSPTNCRSIDAWLGVVARREALAREMQDEWF